MVISYIDAYDRYFKQPMHLLKNLIEPSTMKYLKNKGNIMLSQLKNDLVAGFSVFLLALPLCLGIALASGFPPAAGILTAIIGGVLASWFGGGKLTIKGPAAGLIVITIGAVHVLGHGNAILGYERALAVGIVAACLQIIIALLRKATVAEVMPPAVIHGMLAAIGVIIISKQAYVMFGITPSGHSPLSLLAHLPQSFLDLNPVIFVIGLLALGISIFWPKIKKLSFLPAPMIILACVIPLSMIFDISKVHQYVLFDHSYALSNTYLVSLPLNFFKAIHLPDFSIIFTLDSAKFIVMYTLVGSIESLLTVCAVDSMAPKYAPSNLNRDLLAVGVGNLVSSSIGGLPMISEIVRSKANIEYGAESEKGNFFHGVFMLIAAILIPSIINLIPLSALAALLVFVGFKLVSPTEFKHTYKIGIDQFSLFCTTFIVTLLTDLLIGVCAGILLKFILHICRGNKIKELIIPNIKISIGGPESSIHVHGPLTFLSYLHLKHKIESLMKTEPRINVDLSSVTFIDHSMMVKLDTMQRVYGKSKLNYIKNKHLYGIYHHPLSTQKKK